MDFIISTAKLKSKDIEIICGKDTPSGVRKIASKVAGDIKAVFGAEPAVTDSSKCKFPICVGLAGDKLIANLGIDTLDEQPDILPLTSAKSANSSFFRHCF